MTWTPKRIHKSKPVASKLDHLDPTSILGKWDWELRGDYYYPMPKAGPPVDQAVIDEIVSKRGVIIPTKPISWKTFVPLAPFIGVAIYALIYALTH